MACEVNNAYIAHNSDQTAANLSEDHVASSHSAEILQFPIRPEITRSARSVCLVELLITCLAGRRSAYGVGTKLRDGWGYMTTRSNKDATDLPLAVQAVERHLAGGDPIGIFLFPENDDRVRFAVLDIDNHNGHLPWSDVVNRTQPLYDQLRRVGDVLAMRSGGGFGIHLVLFFAQPEKAVKVRNFLVAMLKACGLKEGAKEGGIQAGVVEVFPTQDQVRGGKGYGSLIALPFARKSVPLDDALGSVDS